MGIDDIRARISSIEARFTPMSAPAPIGATPTSSAPNFASVLNAQTQQLGTTPNTATGIGPAGTSTGTTNIPTTPNATAVRAGSPLDRFLKAALAQHGDAYVWGTETTASQADPDAFDCSELVQWAGEQVGLELQDGSWYQYLNLKQKGAAISVEEALRTPGALLFKFDTPPTSTGGRPSGAHVAISLGDGRTIEARGREWGVGTWDATGRFNYAATIPGLHTA